MIETNASTDVKVLGLKIRDEENNDSQDDPETDADEKPKKVIIQETNKETRKVYAFITQQRQTKTKTKGYLFC